MTRRRPPQEKPLRNLITRICYGDLAIADDGSKANSVISIDCFEQTTILRRAGLVPSRTDLSVQGGSNQKLTSSQIHLKGFEEY